MRLIPSSSIVSSVAADRMFETLPSSGVCQPDTPIVAYFYPKGQLFFILESGLQTPPKSVKDTVLKERGSVEL